MSSVFAASQLLIGFYLICFIWFVLFRRSLRDKAIFEVQMARNNLFEFMMRNGYNFGNEDYQFANMKLEKWEDDLKTLTITRSVIEFYFNFQRGRQNEWLEFIRRIPMERSDDVVAERSRYAMLLGLKAISGLLFVYGIRCVFSAIGVGCLYLMTWIIHSRRVAALRRAGMPVDPAWERYARTPTVPIKGLAGVCIRACMMLATIRTMQAAGA